MHKETESRDDLSQARQLGRAHTDVDVATDRGVDDDLQIRIALVEPLIRVDDGRSIELLVAGGANDRRRRMCSERRSPIRIVRMTFRRCGGPQMTFYALGIQ